MTYVGGMNTINDGFLCRKIIANNKAIYFGKNIPVQVYNNLMHTKSSYMTDD